MSTINSNNICSALQNKLGQYYSPNNTVGDVLSLSLSADIFDTVNTITVPDLDRLPNLQYNTSIQNGMVYYIEDINVHAVSSNGVWLSLDGRIIRTDTFYNVVWSWGANVNGLLGDGTTVSKCSPVLVAGGFTDWCQVSAASFHNLSIRTNGTAWAWGCNGTGRLGDGTTVSKCSPVLVAGGFTDWCQVGAGFGHSLGIRTNGTAWAWGCNGNGRLGDNTTVNKSSPVLVAGGFTDWCQVGAGFGHSLGIRTNGTAWAWGCNSNGQLGDNTIVSKSSPVLVAGGFTDWCQVGAGFANNIGLRSNGTLWAWGYNCFGELGDGTTISKSSPVSVVGGFTDWCQVSAGTRLSLGIRTNGTAWAWGCNTNGEIGDGTTVNKSSPVSVVGGFTDWCQVSAGNSFSVGVRTNGTAWAWGYNNTGRLGDGTIVNKSSPVSIIGGFTDWCQVSAGANHSLGIRKKI